MNISPDSLAAIVAMAKRDGQREGYAQALEDTGPLLAGVPEMRDSARARYAIQAAKKYLEPVDVSPVEAAPANAA